MTTHKTEPCQVLFVSPHAVPWFWSYSTHIIQAIFPAEGATPVLSTAHHPFPRRRHLPSTCQLVTFSLVYPLLSNHYSLGFGNAKRTTSEKEENVSVDTESKVRGTKTRRERDRQTDREVQRLFASSHQPH